MAYIDVNTYKLMLSYVSYAMFQCSQVIIGIHSIEPQCTWNSIGYDKHD